MKDTSKQINLRCSICANDQFSTIDVSFEDLLKAPDETLIECSDCGRIISKEQLIEENRDNIEANINDLKDDVFKEIQKEFKKLFK